jgi:hypothetical protein
MASDHFVSRAICLGQVEEPSEIVPFTVLPVLYLDLIRLGTGYVSTHFNELQPLMAKVTVSKQQRTTTEYENIQLI